MNSTQPERDTDGLTAAQRRRYTYHSEVQRKRGQVVLTPQQWLAEYRAKRRSRKRPWWVDAGFVECDMCGGLVPLSPYAEYEAIEGHDLCDCGDGPCDETEFLP